jgi:uncharacterized protein (DUF2062 family)
VKARLHRLLESFLHTDDTPRRIALAFGIGVYIAFHPLLGLHTLMGLAIAFAFRLSRAAMLAGVYVNNPWTLAPMYVAGTTLGCWLLGVPVGSIGEIEWDLAHRDFRHLLLVSLRPYLWPYVVGNTVLGIAAGLAGYALLLPALERRRRRRPPLSRSPEPGDGGR